jgi:hypothetical protein
VPQQIAVQRRIPVDVYFFNLTLRVFVACCDGAGALAALDQMVGTRYYIHLAQNSVFLFWIL